MWHAIMSMYADDNVAACRIHIAGELKAVRVFASRGYYWRLIPSLTVDSDMGLIDVETITYWWNDLFPKVTMPLVLNYEEQPFDPGCNLRDVPRFSIFIPPI
jgi:hypothetical protein